MAFFAKEDYLNLYIGLYGFDYRFLPIILRFNALTLSKFHKSYLD